MGTDYIATTDAGKLTFAKNMVALITPSATAWGLTTGILTTLTGLVNSYESDLATATEPATKSRAATYAKNLSRNAMVQYIRQTIVPTIQGAAVVTDQMRYDMGLNVRGANPPSPINQPTEAPVFEVLWQKNRTIGVALRRPGSDSRGKPPGVQGASLCMYAGPLPLPTDVTKWVTIGESSRTNFTAEVPVEIEAGETVYLLAFWKNPRLMSGPPSTAVPIVIGEGQQQTA